LTIGYKNASPAWVASAYEGSIKQDLVHPEVGVDGLPAFDLIILGVGPDGHILSVFPGSAVFDSAAWVESVPAPTHIEPHVARVTINPSLVRAARSVLVVTAGAGKADVLARVWAGGDPRELPLRTTLAANATWLVDEAAAANLR
jgi:6-phosphogluconolactonase